MANKKQEPISRWGCAKAILFSGALVVLAAILVDGCDEPGEAVSPYARVLVWIYVLAVIYGLLNAKFKKGWFD